MEFQPDIKPRLAREVNPVLAGAGSAADEAAKLAPAELAAARSPATGGLAPARHRTIMRAVWSLRTHR